MAVQYLKRELGNGKSCDEQDQDLWTPLHFACLKANVEAARVLLDKGANPCAQTRFGRTPLHYAAQVDNNKIVRSLLDYGADPHIKDRRGVKPLDLTPPGDCKVMLLDYEEGGNPNKVEDE
eukprot:CAMPEP_0197853702 /NCGR_PEP_ID=MMETSP1438-20131217/23229_1 /TAXON_ID=1461541 /ORGANISM="Pterosperma sp., Strain CCMP1384" /LENGTH=120 /DNA_ID=CAMNT_0043468199 /DNA_START=320 /DNA_END=682 /DNA_ORIENTATION=+